MSCLLVSTLTCMWVLICSHGVFGGYVKYNTGGVTVEGKLNVHLVPHSHDDVGWLKTVDQYYIGSNTSIQAACVENELDSIVMALRRDPNRKFVFAEMAFFKRWWEEQSVEIQEEVRKLVHAGQLEFVNGGWCMHDEATTHYIGMIDQTSLGHHALKTQFNITPRAGWQIDPFGHSAVQAYLLGAELGFDSVHFWRIDYQDRAKRKSDKSLEVIWRGSKTFGSSSQIFTNIFPNNYYPPDGFNFELPGDYIPVEDNPLLFDYNVEHRVNDFIATAMTQASVTRTNHIMWTMGGDFTYQYAESWFKQMDKLIHYVKEDGRINALYSTPSMYTNAKNGANQTWPLKTEDYFPYAGNENAYWTGYFTSRPALKGYIRMLSGYYLAARQLEYMSGRRSFGPNTYSLGDALGIAQHHDAVSGTAKQHVTNDYGKRLAIGASEAEAVVSSALACLVNSTLEKRCATPLLTLSQCQLLNISFCRPTEEDIPEGKSLVVVAYNSLGWNRTDFVKIPVNDANLVVLDSMGNTIKAQYLELDNVTSNLRDFYTKAYLGTSPGQVPKYCILFQVSLPPLGFNTYFISKATGKGKRRTPYLSPVDLPRDDTVEIGPGNVKMSFSLAFGQLKRMYNSKTGVDIPLQQSYLSYGSSERSGAYISRPNGSPSTLVSRSVRIPLKVVHGKLVHEVHQQFNSWIYQVIRLYKDKEHAEVEFTIGPIPMDDDIGKEIITRMTTNMITNKVFYTDSNGRDFLKRVRDYRKDWPLEVNEPVAGNYYPFNKDRCLSNPNRLNFVASIFQLNLGIYTTDNKSEFSVLVDRAVGGSSIQDGEVEIMLHRRMVSDDGKGVGEVLNEKVCVKRNCKGLTARGKYYISIDPLGAGSRWRRTTGQEIYSPILLAFTHEKFQDWIANQLLSVTSMDPHYTLPINVALVTLQELDDGNVLLRLAHLYEAGEDAEYSTLAKVELKKVFSGKTIKKVKEMSLSANQEKSQMKKMTWKVEGDSGEKKPVAIRGSPVGDSDLVVELGPMEIRTFILNF